LAHFHELSLNPSPQAKPPGFSGKNNQEKPRSKWTDAFDPGYPQKTMPAEKKAPRPRHPRQVRDRGASRIQTGQNSNG